MGYSFFLRIALSHDRIRAAAQGAMSSLELAAQHDSDSSSIPTCESVGQAEPQPSNKTS